MEFREFYLALDPDEREEYAQRAGTTTKYMPQLIAMPPFKIAKPELIRALADASEGHVSLEEVLSHFYGQPRHRGPRREVSDDGPERTGNEQEVGAQA